MNKCGRPLNLRIALRLGICLSLCTGQTMLLTGRVIAANGKPANTAKTANEAKAASTVKATPELSSAKLIGLVQSAHILDPDYPVHVTLEDKEAIVVTVRHPQATEQDCKIDAVLLAKTIMEVYPQVIARVKLVLSDSNSDAMNEITVTTGDVKAYATGTISKDELMASLEIKKVETSADDRGPALDLKTSAGETVPPGPYRSYRQILAGRIEKLKANGTGTKPFEEMLAKIQEECAKPAGNNNPSEIQGMIKDLYQKLAEQEQAIRQAQNIASGATRYASSGADRLSRGFAAGMGNKGRAGNGLGRRRGNGMGGQGNSNDSNQAGQNANMNGGMNSGAGAGAGMDSSINALSGTIFARLKQLVGQRQNVSGYYAEMARIRGLRKQGLKTEAYQQLQSLAAKLGIN